MTTQQVADRLIGLCRQGQYEQAISELYAPDAISVEPEGVPDRIVQGLDQIHAKGEAFNSKIEKVNSSFVSDPVVADNFFSCSMLMNVNMKGMPIAINMNEVCVYTVANGKITKEEFFYTPQPNPEE